MNIRRTRNSYAIILKQVMNKDIGILGMEIYFPRSYVEQSELGTRATHAEDHYKASKGKYTLGLGQDRLSFAYEFEDVNSMSLTGKQWVTVVVDRLLRNYGVDPNKVGRLEIGTETLLDKSKSTKTVLMTLFKDNHDIEGKIFFELRRNQCQRLLRGHQCTLQRAQLGP